MSGHNREVQNEAGFTLIELLVVVAIVGVLASLAVPSYGEYRQRANIARTAAEMRSFVAAFVAFDADTGNYPDDSHRILPDGMTDYLSQSIWDDETPIGGYYNWDGPNSYPYAGIAIFNCPATLANIRTLDRMLDDGDTSQGRFRITPNGRPTLIVEE